MFFVPGLRCTLAPLAIFDQHVLIANHHLHLAFIHEIAMVFRQIFAILVVHEFGKGLPIREHERADGVVVQQLRVPTQDVLHMPTVRGEMVRLVLLKAVSSVATAGRSGRSPH